jgi:hypothetical protein
MSGGTLNHVINLLRSNEELRRIGQHPPVYGDCPFVCQEMRMGHRRRAGGGAERAAAHPVGNEIAPHASVNSR